MMCCRLFYDKYFWYFYCCYTFFPPEVFFRSSFGACPTTTDSIFRAWTNVILRIISTTKTVCIATSFLDTPQGKKKSQRKQEKGKPTRTGSYAIKFYRIEGGKSNWWRYGDLSPRCFACEGNTLPRRYTPATNWCAQLAQWSLSPPY